MQSSFLSLAELVKLMYKQNKTKCNRNWTSKSWHIWLICQSRFYIRSIWSHGETTFIDKWSVFYIVFHLLTYIIQSVYVSGYTLHWINGTALEILCHQVFGFDALKSNSFITAMDGNGYKFSGNSIKIFYYFWKEVTFILHQKKLIHMDSSSQWPDGRLMKMRSKHSNDKCGKGNCEHFK